ncbi:MAG TPA: hypothetical protein VEV63_11350 [Streptosporangiaceae bacterium]|nr:hypothetical protein [Streptosporangiaceae bacterium]
MIIAAALCPSPPLLMPGLTGAASVLPELRRACEQAVTELVAADPDVVAVVGPGEQTMIWDAAARLDLAAFAPGIGVAVLPMGDALPTGGHLRAPDGTEPTAVHPGSGLPVSLGIGAWLLDQAGHAGELLLQSVASHESAERCARLGADLATAAIRTGLLVLADGSACRNPKAPGYFDERSAGFDAEVERTVRAGDLGALLDIDAELAGDLMATGRPAWQVLAGALTGERLTTEIRYCDDPFGVAYLVASLRVEPLTAPPAKG